MSVAVLNWTAAQWKAGPRVERYQILREVESDFVLIGTLDLDYSFTMEPLGPPLTWVDTNVEAGVTYRYKVLAIASNGRALRSNTITIAVAPEDVLGLLKETGEAILQEDEFFILLDDTPVPHLLQEDLFAVLQEDLSFILITDIRAPSFINLVDHTVVSTGGAGFGPQTPNLFIGFGRGDLIPLGQLTIYGGGSPGGFTIDGVEQPADPLGYGNQGKQYTDQWWNGVTPPVPAAYQIRLTVLSGNAPTGSPDVWIPMENEPIFGYSGAGSPNAGVWFIEIRDGLTTTVLGSATFDMSQQVV